MLACDWLKGELTSESPTNHRLLLIAAHDVVKMEPWDSEQNTHFLWSAAAFEFDDTLNDEGLIQGQTRSYHSSKVKKLWPQPLVRKNSGQHRHRWTNKTNIYNKEYYYRLFKKSKDHDISRNFKIFENYTDFMFYTAVSTPL